MTPHSAAARPELRRLPDTLDGLWTAITVTQEVARRARATLAEGSARALDSSVEHLETAAATLATSRTRAMVRMEVPPVLVGEDVSGHGLGLDCLITDCLDLSLDVLANEDEPLTPVEILAITRSVSALCSARRNATEVTA
jgi:CRISPR/Cas system-associated exonuclease Cas4 (RecB family)